MKLLYALGYRAFSYIDSSAFCPNITLSLSVLSVDLLSSLLRGCPRGWEGYLESQMQCTHLNRKIWGQLHIGRFQVR